MIKLINHLYLMLIMFVKGLKLLMILIVNLLDPRNLFQELYYRLINWISSVFREVWNLAGLVNKFATVLMVLKSVFVYFAVWMFDLGIQSFYNEILCSQFGCTGLTIVYRLSISLGKELCLFCGMIKTMYITITELMTKIRILYLRRSWTFDVIPVLSIILISVWLITYKIFMII